MPHPDEKVPAPHKLQLLLATIPSPVWYDPGLQSVQLASKPSPDPV